MNLEKEKDMYPAVCEWLKNVLKNKFKRAEIQVFDTSNVMLSKFLVEKGYHIFFILFVFIAVFGFFVCSPR